MGDSKSPEEVPLKQPAFTDGKKVEQFQLENGDEPLVDCLIDSREQTNSKFSFCILGSPENLEIQPDVEEF